MSKLRSPQNQNTIIKRAQGYEIAKKDLLQFLDGFKEAIDVEDRWA